MRNKKIKYVLISSAVILASGVSLLYSNCLKSEAKETKAEVNTLNSDSENSESEFQYMNKIFNKEEVLSINIEISEDDWNDLLENAEDEEYHKVTIHINGEEFTDVGIRAKGNSSLSTIASDDTTDRYSFKIKTDKYVDGQNIYGLTKFVLNSNIGDATSMKEYLSYDILNSMGVKTPGYSYANISINDETWGLYLAVESIEEEFIERTFGDSDGNLYKVESMSVGNMGNDDHMPNDKNFDLSNDEMPENLEPPSKNSAPQNMEPPNDATFSKNGGISENIGIPNDSNMPNGMEIPEMKDMNKPMGNITSGGNLIYTDDNISSYSDIFDNAIFKSTTEEDYSTLINIIKNLNEGTDLEEYIDVDEVLRYFAVNTFIVNLDSYVGQFKHNYYIYEDHGQMSILPWDYNLSFAAFNISSAKKAVNFPIDNPVTDSLENNPLLSKLLEVLEYKEIYHEYLKEIADNYFTNNYFEDTVNKLDTLVGDYIKNDPTAFYSYDEYKTAIENLVLFGNDRTICVLAQLDGTQSSTKYGTIETTVNLEAMGTQNSKKMNK